MLISLRRKDTAPSLGFVRALDVPSQDRQGHAAARLCLCWIGLDILRWDTQQSELVLQQRHNIPSCAFRKHLASLKVPKCRRQSEMGSPIFLVAVGALYPEPAFPWCQRVCGREWRQSWAFLYIFPHVTEFLRLLLLLQHGASVVILVLPPSLTSKAPTQLCTCPVFVCVSLSMGSGMLAKGTGLPSIQPSIPALLWTPELGGESSGQQMSAQPPHQSSESLWSRSGAPSGIVPAPVRAGSHSCTTMEAQQAPLGTKPNLRDTRAEKALPKKMQSKAPGCPVSRDTRYARLRCDYLQAGFVRSGSPECHTCSQIPAGTMWGQCKEKPPLSLPV